MAWLGIFALDPRGEGILDATARLAPADGASPSMDGRSGDYGRLGFPEVPPGWYVLSVAAGGFREYVVAFRFETTSGYLRCTMRPVPLPGYGLDGPAPVLTVCEAL